LQEFNWELNFTDILVFIYEKPYTSKKDNTVPANRYIGGVDPVEFGKKEVGNTFSYASIIIMDSLTERIVAEYIGRPDNEDDFYELCRRLAIYYIADINYENNLKGIYRYFMTKGAIKYLADAPRLLKDKLSINSSSDRPKGTTASEKVNKYARLRVRDWLGKQAYGKEEGVTNIQILRSKRLLNELINWNIDGNYDMVSALMMLMIILDEKLAENYKNRLAVDLNLMVNSKLMFEELKLKYIFDK
jgi:hypothetical protein